MKIHSVINKSFQTRKGASVLVESARDMGWVVELMEVGPEWHMWKKPMKVDDRLGKIPHDMLFIYCDALDVEVRISPDDFCTAYKRHFEGKAVFNGEVNQTVWLDKSPIDYKPHMIAPGPLSYLNAGVFFGRVYALREVVNAWVENLIPHEEYYTASKYGCDQAPLLHTWSENKDLPIVVDWKGTLTLATRGLGKHPLTRTVPFLHRNERTAA